MTSLKFIQIKMQSSSSVTCLMSLCLSVVLVLAMIGHARSEIAPRPNVDEVAQFARWLVGQSNFGILSTLAVGEKREFVPFGTIISFADAGTGEPYFYLSPELDPSGQNSKNNTSASFALSEALLGLCNATDAQSPHCARITLSGKLQIEEEGSEEERFGEAALFDKHPQLTGFPKMSKKFRVFKLVIKDIYLVNKAAKERELSVQEYLRL